MEEQPFAGDHVGRTFMVHHKPKKDNVLIYWIRKVFHYFGFPAESTQQTVEFCHKHSKMLNHHRSVETALILASLIGCAKQPGWQIHDYIRAFPQPVETKGLRKMQLIITLLFSSLTTADRNLPTQLEYMLDKIFPIVIKQMKKKFKKTSVHLQRNNIKETAQKLIDLSDHFLIREGRGNRPTVGAAILIAALYVQQKGQKKISNAKSPLRFWQFDEFSDVLVRGHHAMKTRYFELIKLLKECYEKVPWLTSVVSGQYAVYLLDDIFSMFNIPQAETHVAYQRPVIRRAEEGRAVFEKALSEAELHFKANLCPETNSILEYQLYKLLSEGYTVDELKDCHESMIRNIFHSIIFKEEHDFIQTPDDLDNPIVNNQDMSEKEISFYIKNGTLVPDPAVVD
ncbi:unnamed protein product [Rhizopus microsporus]